MLNKPLPIKESCEPYRPTLEAIHKLLLLANVRENERWQVILRFNQLCENYDVNQARNLLHLMFRRKV